MLQSCKAQCLMQMFTHACLPALMKSWNRLQKEIAQICWIYKKHQWEKKKNFSFLMLYLCFHEYLDWLVDICLPSCSQLSLKKSFKNVCCDTVAFWLLGPVNLRAFPFCALSSFSPPPLIPLRAVKSCLQAVWLPFHPVKGCVCVCACVCSFAQSSHK